MVVQHNLTAMNSNRMLGVTTKQQAKTTEKLSSGYKINRAADDAAGLAISEKMRKQIRGLTQASANAQDGISAVQTAEGALTEVHDMLQRMNELAVKAANGTQSVSDREAIQSEINQLVTEIDRVSETTKFNETYLLKGDKDAEKQYSFSYGARTLAAGDFTTTAKATTVAGSNTGATVTAALTAPNNEAEAALQNQVLKALQTSGVRVSLSPGGKAAADVAISLDGYDIDKDGNVSKNGVKSGVALTVGGTISENKEKTEKADILTWDPDAVGKEAANGHAVFYDRDGNKISENALDKYLTASTAADGKVSVAQLKDKKLYDQFGNEVTLGTNEVTGKQDIVGGLDLSLHVGADATKNNKIELTLDAMSSKALGINGIRIDGSTSKNADNAIETIKAAINKVSAQRSDLGAVQNRLEHTINNLDNVVENTTSAESAIRDTDMASTMVKYSNNNILAQAGTSMLAQANQSNQSVLSLLQ